MTVFDAMKVLDLHGVEHVDFNVVPSTTGYGVNQVVPVTAWKTGKVCPCRMWAVVDDSHAIVSLHMTTRDAHDERKRLNGLEGRDEGVL
jgi:hypothetical protein